MVSAGVESVQEGVLHHNANQVQAERCTPFNTPPYNLLHQINSSTFMSALADV